MKIKLTDSSVITCKSIVFKGRFVLIDDDAVFKSDFIEDVVAITDDNEEV